MTFQKFNQTLIALFFSGLTYTAFAAHPSMHHHPVKAAKVKTHTGGAFQFKAVVKMINNHRYHAGKPPMTGKQKYHLFKIYHNHPM